jgi:hypothetical protein
MSSAYGMIKAKAPSSPLPLPVRGLLKDGSPFTIEELRESSPFMAQLHAIFKLIVEDGNSYPQESVPDLQQFKDYFLSHRAFVAYNNSAVLGGFSYPKNYSFLHKAKLPG